MRPTGSQRHPNGPAPLFVATPPPRKRELGPRRVCLKIVIGQHVNLLVNQPLQEMPPENGAARLRWNLALTLLPAVGGGMYVIATAAGIFRFDAPAALIIAAIGMAAAAAAYLTNRSFAAMRATQRRLEAALREARAAGDKARSDHARLFGAFNLLPEPVILFDADDRIVMWNRHYDQSSSLAPGHGDGSLRPGMSFTELMKANLAKGRFPAAVGREDEWLADRLAKHAQATVTFEHQLSSDQWARIEERRTPEGGSIGVRIDITDLKRSEASFRLLFEDNPVPMCVFDHHTLQFLAVNQAMAEHHGYSREQFLSMSILDITPPEERETARASIATLGANRSHTGRVWRHLKADGTEILIAAYSRGIEYEGRSARLTAIIDVTERGKAEEELRSTRAFLEQIIDNVPLSITVKDAEQSRFVMMNRTAEQYWGVPRTEAIGKTVAELFGDERARNVASRDQAALEADGPIYLGEHRKVGRGDQDRMFSSHRVAVRDSLGKPTYVLGVMEDVTERRRAEDDLRRTRAFLDTVIENVPAMLFVKDPKELRYMLVNRAGERLLGISRDEIIGKNDHDLLPEAEADIAVARDREILRSLEPSDAIKEEPIHTPHNGTRLLSTKRIVVLDQDSNPRYLLGVAEDITERKLAEERIEHLAHFDGLTELPNRAAFTVRLAEAIQTAERTGNSFALLFLDLDRFKEVNDVFGHGVGDALLLEVAKRLKQAGEGAFVARLGGDEFTLIVEGTQPAAASAVAQRILALISEEIQVEERRLRAGVSVGIALFPNDAEDASMLLANADAALYRAKAHARGSVRFFEAEMDMQLRERRALQQDLQKALSAGEMSLYYQPQVRVSGETTGFEALIRWHHPVRGMISPATFIPLAEESGAIIELGKWVMREACREAASWPNPLQIAVNLSPLQFRGGDLPELVHLALLESGLPAHRLELEVTEGVLIDDFDRALSILRRLKALGVRIAMDDFGTGYSSLSYLQSFPFDKIKIDRSFISNVESNAQSAAIVRAVIGLARGLDLPVLAEGVETAEQLAFLSRELCDEAQGFLLGRPKPIEHYADLVCNTADAAPDRKVVENGH
jgi:diguanylate cyclase (GGDEF)-like protein/PAS domain S-box-containing protein